MTALAAAVDYDNVYETPEYQDLVGSLETIGNVEATIRHPTYAPFFRSVKPKRAARLLDVGCGVGRFCHAAQSLGWQVSGIDVSAAAINAGTPYASFRLSTATLGDVVERGEQFDVVTGFEVLEHLREPLEFVRLAQRALVPGGEVFFTVPNWDCEVVQKATRPDWLPPIHLSFFSREALRRLAMESGLTRFSTGVISTDVPPAGLRSALTWLKRRLRRKSADQLGLWLHGVTPLRKRG